MTYCWNPLPIVYLSSAGSYTKQFNNQGKPPTVATDLQWSDVIFGIHDFWISFSCEYKKIPKPDFSFCVNIPYGYALNMT